MLLAEILTERWEKGHLSSQQLIRTVKQFVGNKGDVIELPKDEQRKTNNVIKISMFYHDFLEKFGPKGVVDKLMNMDFQINNLDKNNDEFLNSYQYELRNSFRNQQTDIIKLLQRRARFFNKIHYNALNKLRTIIPEGWMLTGEFEPFQYADVHDSKITFFIKRDFTPKMERQDVYYHITKLSSLDNIMKNGLIPAHNKRFSFDGYRNRIFLNTIYPDYDFTHQLITGSVFSSKTDPEIALLKVTLPKDIQPYEDDQAREAVFVDKNIPPNNITVIYAGPLSKAPLHY